MPDDKAGALEKHQLPTEVRDSLDELRALSSKAEDGDKDAKKELRRKLREASPQVVARASDISRTAQHMLIRTAAAKDPLTQGALSGRLDMMREEIAGENPTSLEVLLTERIVSCWMVVTLFEVLMAGQLNADAKSRTPLSYTLKMLKWQESAHRQYLAAIRELARVRKLEASLPTVQVNNQVNILQG